MGAPSLLDERGATQRRLLQALREMPAGVSVDQLSRTLGITANAVRQHVTALERDRLIVHRIARAPRGRPQHLYQLTALGLEAFPRRYRELAEVALAELGTQLGSAALRRAMRRMGDGAARATRAQPASAMATAKVMQELGYAAESRTSAGNGDEIIARNCVFHRLAEQFPAVCEFDLGFLEAATGRHVEHRECMVRGGTVCRFGLTGPRKRALKASSDT